jgi:hypothetical protein
MCRWVGCRNRITADQSPQGRTTRSASETCELQLSTPMASRGFLLFSAGLVGPERARGRRWIDCYCNAGEATQRRAAFYPL